MSKKILLITIAILMAAGLFLFNTAGMAQSQKPKAAPTCIPCHAPDEKILMGTMTRVLMDAATIQMQVGPATWLVKFVPAEVKLIGAKALDGIPKDSDIFVTITEKKGELYADRVAVKQPITVAPEKLIMVAEVAKLVDLGAEKGNFLIIDARPATRYHEGHIPGAISIYFADFDKNVDKLPKEKDRMLIFYCGGPT